MPIDKEYVIVSDDRQFKLCTREISGEDAKNSNQEYDQTQGFYTTIQGALRGYLQHKIKGSEADGIQEVKDLLVQIDKNINELEI